jgi:CRISPR type III-B/RAMP module RAMP protein Cmr6
MPEIPKPGPPRPRPGPPPGRTPSAPSPAPAVPSGTAGIPGTPDGSHRRSANAARRPAGDAGTPLKAVGPLRRVIRADAVAVKGRVGDRVEPLGAGANALILLRRVVFLDDQTGKVDKEGVRALLRWAAGQHLGQETDLVRWAAARREQVHRALHAQGLKVVRIRARPEWRLVVGLGNRDNPNEIGLALHGTYGWPIIPGSSLKGLIASWAAGPSPSGGRRADATRLDEIFGTPRPGRPVKPGEATRGSVRFLDALPAGEPVQVAVDVLTPHVQPYYGDKDHATPPAEHHNPIPFEFLVIRGGTFAVDLAGPAADVDLAASWCRAAFDELGAGAKTTAGYGYLSAEETT